MNYNQLDFLMTIHGEIILNQNSMNFTSILNP